MIDLTATLAALYGLPLDQISGRVLGADEEGYVRESFLYSEGSGLPHLSVEQDGLRLIYRWSGEVSVYDIVKDPYELQDICRLTDSRQEMLLQEMLSRRDRISASVLKHLQNNEPKCRE